MQEKQEKKEKCTRYQCTRCTKKTKTKSAMLPTSMMSFLFSVHFVTKYVSIHLVWTSVVLLSFCRSPPVQTLWTMMLKCYAICYTIELNCMFDIGFGTLYNCNLNLEQTICPNHNETRNYTGGGDLWCYSGMGEGRHPNKKKRFNSGIAQITYPPPPPNSGNFTDFVQPSWHFTGL